MKFLVLSYGSLKDINIGDYIQSLAAIQNIYPNKYSLVDREMLNLYKGENSLLIMNCWFTSVPKSFPPAKNIKPLFISFHLNKSASKEILSIPNNILYFKKYEPIGCRDRYTVDLLKSKNIKAYFSGCLTTTLYKSYKLNFPNHKICAVDLVSTLPIYQNIFAKLLDYYSVILFSLKNLNKVSYILKNLKKNCPIRINTIFKFLFYWIYSSRTLQIIQDTIHINNFKKIEFYTHVFESSAISEEDERFQFADRLLKIYSQSSLILTSRLHCMLPSLSFGVPSIYFNQVRDNELSSCRKRGIIELFNRIDLDRSSVVNNPFGKIENISNIKNKNNFLNYVKKLEIAIKDYLNEKES